MKILASDVLNYLGSMVLHPTISSKRHIIILVEPYEDYKKSSNRPQSSGCTRIVYKKISCAWSNNRFRR